MISTGLTPFSVYTKLRAATFEFAKKYPVYSLWLGEQKTEFLNAHPDVPVIDGHIVFSRDIQIMHKWIVQRWMERNS